jgi:hypothetical protein
MSLENCLPGICIVRFQESEWSEASGSLGVKAMLGICQDNADVFLDPLNARESPLEIHSN